MTDTRESMLPTFIGIGAQRAGTTWAYNYLAQNPNVYMSERKELHFFYAHCSRGLDWYASQFAAAGDAVARGEISPDYMYSREALTNIARDLPGVRVFAILRNPIDRAISAIGFIGVRQGVRPAAMGTRYNRVIYPGLQKALLGARLGWIIDAVKSTPVGLWVRQRNSATRRSSGIATAVDLGYLRTAFADDVRELSRRLGRDLGGWLH